MEEFARLANYLAIHGHVSPAPRETFEGHPVGDWVRLQRLRSSRRRMPAWERRKLDAIGFVWKPQATGWTEGLRCLHEFRVREGHCRVTPGHVERGFPLGAWVRYFRHRWRQGALPADRVLALRMVGFLFGPHESKWEEGFEHLLAFRTETGHCHVPAMHRAADGYRLGRWVSTQRAAAGNGTLPDDRHSRLALVGFVWRLRGRSPGPAGIDRPTPLADRPRCREAPRSVLPTL